MRATGSRSSNTTRARAGATGRCAAATATPNSAARRRSAGSTRTCTSTRARGGSPTTTAACSTTARRLGVPLEPFVQVNYNAYLHSSQAFGGKPQRYREVKADYQGHVAELLAKATRQSALDDRSARRIRKNCSNRCASGARSTPISLCRERRDQRPARIHEAAGRRLERAPDALRADRPRGHPGLASVAGLPNGDVYDMQTSMFQPVGGMGRVGEAFGRELGPLIRYSAKWSRSVRTSAASSSATRTRPAGRPDARARAIGACARFRCRSWRRSR